MRTKVTLTPYDKVLTGKYPNDTDTVYVLLDTSTGNFTVDLPDCKCNNQIEFRFKNIGNNTAIVQPATGQYIDNSLYFSISSWDSLTLWSDLAIRWLVMDKNAVLILR